jgi:hypothetical protein
MYPPGYVLHDQNSYYHEAEDELDKVPPTVGHALSQD